MSNCGKFRPVPPAGVESLPGRRDPDAYFYVAAGARVAVHRTDRFPGRGRELLMPGIKLEPLAPGVQAAYWGGQRMTLGEFWQIALVDRGRGST